MTSGRATGQRDRFVEWSFPTAIRPQASRSADVDLRRYAMKPMPAKPISIIAHVEGSGTLLPIPSLKKIE